MNRFPRTTGSDFPSASSTGEKNRSICKWKGSCTRLASLGYWAPSGLGHCRREGAFELLGTAPPPPEWPVLLFTFSVPGRVHAAGPRYKTLPNSPLLSTRLSKGCFQIAGVPIAHPSMSRPPWLATPAWRWT